MMFYATGGQHLNSDDFFKAHALDERQAVAKAMMSKKETCQERLVLAQEAKSILQLKAIDLTPPTEKNFLVPECKRLCKWKGCKLMSTP